MFVVLSISYHSPEFRNLHILLVCLSGMIYSTELFSSVSLCQEKTLPAAVNPPVASSPLQRGAGKSRRRQAAVSTRVQLPWSCDSCPIDHKDAYLIRSSEDEVSFASRRGIIECLGRSSLLLGFEIE